MLLRLGWVVEHLFEELELCEGGEWEEKKEEEGEVGGGRGGGGYADEGHLLLLFSCEFCCG